MRIFGTVLHLITEWTAKNLSYVALDERLQRSGQHVEQKLAGARELPLNLEAAKHIVGIERWGQQRLRTVLGEPLVMDEYDSYRPEAISTMQALTAEFREARQETRNLLQRLQKERNTTILLISHELSIVYRYADQVLCLNREMLCHGKPHDVLHPQDLTRLFGEGSFFKHENSAHRH